MRDRSQLATGFAVAGGLLVLTLVAMSPLLLPSGARFNDFRVFRLGADAALHGRLYAARTSDGYPFTYPPFAAICFLPLLLPYAVALLGWLAMSAAALLAVVHRVWGRLGAITSYGGRRWLATGIAVTAVMIPVRNGFRFGQIELLLAALVVLDVVPPTRAGATSRSHRLCGIGVGLATAVKLTPGLFIVVLAVSDRRMEALRAAGTAVLAWAVAFAVWPDQSAHYWTSALFAYNRYGRVDGVGNQSITGALLRLGITDSALHLAAGVLGLTVVVIAVTRARRALLAGAPVAAITVAGAATTLVSPLSWTHHYTWLVLALPVLWTAVSRTHAARIGAGVLGIVLLVSPLLRFDSFTLAALAIVVWLPFECCQPRSETTEIRAEAVLSR